MAEAVGNWTVAVDAWVIFMILCTVIGAGFAGYGSGIAKGVQQVDEHLQDLGIVAHPTENLITIYEPAEDKVVATITWDEEWVELTRHDVEEQEWSSDGR